MLEVDPGGHVRVGYRAFIGGIGNVKEQNVENLGTDKGDT